MRTTTRFKQAGFTLLEVLVALGVMSVIAILSWQGLDNIIRLADRIRLVDEVTADWKSTFSQMDRDFKGVPVQRTGAIPGGAKISPVVQVNNQGITLIVNNPNNQQRAQWSYLRWAMVDNQLVRSVAPYTTADDLVKPAVLLGPSIRGLRVRLWFEGSGWTEPTAYGQAIPALNTENRTDNSSSVLIPALVTTAPTDNANGNNPNNAAPAGAGFNSPTGIELTVWLTDKRIYKRVLRIGSAL